MVHEFWVKEGYCVKYIFQFARITAFCLAGEVLAAVLPLPIPASVYGLLLMVAALKTGLLKLEQVRETGLFLTGIFPLLFVPAAAVLTSLGSVLAMAWVLRLERSHAVSFLPKSVTTAIGMDVAETLGGTAALAGAVIILTGIVGSLLGETVCRICHITDPLAKGLALGTSAHAIGTSKALQMGEIEGAMSGLAIAVAGIMTALLAPVAANFLP